MENPRREKPRAEEEMKSTKIDEETTTLRSQVISTKRDQHSKYISKTQTYLKGTLLQP